MSLRLQHSFYLGQSCLHRRCNHLLGEGVLLLASQWEVVNEEKFFGKWCKPIGSLKERGVPAASKALAGDEVMVPVASVALARTESNVSWEIWARWVGAQGGQTPNPSPHRRVNDLLAFDGLWINPVDEIDRCHGAYLLARAKYGFESVEGVGPFDVDLG